MSNFFDMGGNPLDDAELIQAVENAAIDVNYSTSRVRIGTVMGRLWKERIYVDKNVMIDLLISWDEIHGFPRLFSRYPNVAALKSHGFMYSKDLVDRVHDAARSIDYSGYHGDLSEIVRLTGLEDRVVLDALRYSKIDWSGNGIRKYFFPSVLLIPPHHSIRGLERYTNTARAPKLAPSRPKKEPLRFINVSKKA